MNTPSSITPSLSRSPNAAFVDAVKAIQELPVHEVGQALQSAVDDALTEIAKRPGKRLSPEEMGEIFVNKAITNLSNALDNSKGIRAFESSSTTGALTAVTGLYTKIVAAGYGIAMGNDPGKELGQVGFDATMELANPTDLFLQVGGNNPRMANFLMHQDGQRLAAWKSRN